jgi:ribosomal protein S18 acetylase RimI-like enzyme
MLVAMLDEAFNWSPDRPRLAITDLMANPHISLYVSGWHRAGDVGMIAVDATGQRLGAAWYRSYTQDSHGYGFVDEATPEVTIGVVPDARGQGIGRKLLNGLIAEAISSGVSALSLSVEPANTRARTLYERSGFTRLGEGDGSWTMRLVLPHE